MLEKVPSRQENIHDTENKRSRASSPCESGTMARNLGRENSFAVVGRPNCR